MSRRSMLWEAQWRGVELRSAPDRDSRCSPRPVTASVRQKKREQG
jgi:hypothetical protein